MKLIAFKKLKIQNFLSIGSEPVEIDFTPGLNVITGINKDKEDRRNGVGKSTIADAIFFVTFGQALRPIKNEHVVHDLGTGKCACSLDVDIINNDTVSKVHIVRTLCPSTVEITVDGVDKTRDSIANTTQYIQQLLSCTPEVFEHCVILTINTAQPFMSQKKQDKRKFIESIFNLEVFSKMLAEVKSRYSKNKSVFDAQADKYSDLVTTVTQLQDQQKNIESNKAKRITTLTELKNTLLSQKGKIEAAIKAIEAKDLIAVEKEIKLKQKNIADRLKSTKTARDTVIKTIGEHQSTIKTLTSTVNKITNNQDTCAWCFRAPRRGISYSST